jgi:hypothetical protein
MSGKRYGLTILILSLVGAIYALIYGQFQKHYERVWPHKYVYDNYDTVTPYVFYIKDKDDKEAYFQFINDEKSGKKTVTINFPFDNFLARGEMIYIKRNLSDSNLLEFYCPERQINFFTFSTGYIHKNFVHDSIQKR